MRMEDHVTLKPDPQQYLDRRLSFKNVSTPVLGSLRWPSRPIMPDGNLAWTYMVEGDNPFAVFVGQTENRSVLPFECWVNGAKAPRGLTAVAKTLSADMRCQDGRWLQRKLGSLAKTKDDRRIKLEFTDRNAEVTSASAALAQIVQYRLRQLGLESTAEDEPSPLMDALMAQKEPKGATVAWACSILNPSTGDDFELFLKEAQVGDMSRPYSIWCSGDYPRDLDGLSKLLSIDMQIVDPSWVGMKLRKLLNHPEAGGQFFARVPGQQSKNWPSTVAFISALIIERYRQLGILDANGNAVRGMGVMVKTGTA